MSFSAYGFGCIQIISGYHNYLHTTRFGSIYSVHHFFPEYIRHTTNTNKRKSGESLHIHNRLTTCMHSESDYSQTIFCIFFYFYFNFFKIFFLYISFTVSSPYFRDSIQYTLRLSRHRHEKSFSSFLYYRVEPVFISEWFFKYDRLFIE